ncbi:MexH family multidrug efflux RND transporter periplasmic adaptor subunit [Lacimicrobium alkaliphilum]|uniref:MexH family multidrug efflux RND transporter periplasmic adaptor subunit n=2 Tax=Lacimicrobium alkaliphilum TaxID=1526571 RepID=A0ABQ1QW17_9ALTE|nr:MexH family multidrug efflux RND transporter periplasmic adaptor subunit [Lacimicrobium alkaliphilum]
MCSLFVMGQELLKVEGTRVSKQPIKQQVPLSGTVVPARKGWLSTQVSGLVTAIYIDSGDTVRQGQVVLQLDDKLIRLAVASAEAEAVMAEESLREARRRLDEARALTSQQSIAETEVEALASDAREAQARWQGAKAEVERQQLNLDRHRLQAPFSGVLTARDIDVGEWLTPGQGLLELTDNSQLYADFRAPQRFYSLVDEDTMLKLSFDAYPEKEFDYPVHRRIPGTRDGGRSFGVRVSLQNEQSGDPHWYPGMSVSARMMLDMGRNEVTVPNDALLRHPDGRITVWVAEKNAQLGQPTGVRQVQVRTGLQFENNIEIREGISGSEIVIVRGNEALSQEQQVMLRQAAH